MSDIKFNSKSAETLAKWYLRLNGYFIVDNFIVHAGEDEGGISGEIVGNHTETDLLAVRFKFNEETSGITIPKDEEIVHGENPLIDFLITEVKTGNANKLNSPWIKKPDFIANYILRYAGFLEPDNVSDVATQLAENGFYTDDNNNFAIRLVLISQTEANNQWKDKVTNILFDNIIDYFVQVWGMSWNGAGIGSASKHDQWDDLIRQVFHIANDQTLEIEIRKQAVKDLLL